MRAPLLTFTVLGSLVLVWTWSAPTRADEPAPAAPDAVAPAVAPAPAPAAAATAAPAPVPKPRAPRPRPPKLGFRMAVGGDLTLDGAGGAHPGLGLRVQRTTGERAALELAAIIDFPAEVGDDRVTFDVWRIPLVLGVEVAVGQRSARWRFSLVGQGGMVLYRVKPSATSPGATASATTDLAGTVGAAARLRLSIGGRSAVELGAGLDVVVAQPKISYALGDDVVQVDRPWYVQPHLGIWLVVW